MTADVAVRPEADSRLRFLQALDDISVIVEEAREALVEGRWSDRAALEDIARAVVLLVEALEGWVGSPTAKERDYFKSERELHPEDHGW